MNELELYHHGVKGMKWGVRRYQDKNGRLTAAGKQNKKNRQVNAKIEEFIKSGKARVTNLEHYEVGGLTTFINKGREYVSALVDPHDFDWQEKTNYNDLGLMSTSRIIRDNPNAHRFGDDEDVSITHARGDIDPRDLRECNPGFGDPGTTQNCAKCSAALEMRLRGYGISAGRQTYPSSADSPELWFKDARRIDCQTAYADSFLQSWGPKTSGTLSIRFPGGRGGHAMHWTNNVDDVLSIQDGQNGRVFSSVREMMDEYGADHSLGITTYRLDNCEPNWDAFEQDSVIRRASGAGVVQNRNSGEIVDSW